LISHFFAIISLFQYFLSMLSPPFLSPSMPIIFFAYFFRRLFLLRRLFFARC